MFKENPSVKLVKEQYEDIMYQGLPFLKLFSQMFQEQN